MRACAVMLACALCVAPVAQAANCSVSATDVAFGNYVIGNLLPTDGTGTVSVNCTGTAALGETVTAQVKLSTGGSNSYAQRRLLSGVNTLNYNLYTDPTHLNVWGTPAAASAQTTIFILPLGLSQQQNLIIYGRAPAAQNVRAGSYSDAITVTVTY